MSMREEVLKLAEECGLDAAWLADCDNEAQCMNRFYQAAYLAGAKAMQEEADKICNAHLNSGEVGVLLTRMGIRTINPENL